MILARVSLVDFAVAWVSRKRSIQLSVCSNTGVRRFNTALVGLIGARFGRIAPCGAGRPPRTGAGERPWSSVRRSNAALLACARDPMEFRDSAGRELLAGRESRADPLLKPDRDGEIGSGWSGCPRRWWTRSGCRRQPRGRRRHRASVGRRTGRRTGLVGMWLMADAASPRVGQPSATVSHSVGHAVSHASDSVSQTPGQALCG